MVKDPVQIDGKHYKVVSENDQVRVLRVSYGPHEKSVMHEHPSLVAVFLNDANFRFTFSDGRTEENSGKAGDTLVTVMPNGDLYPGRRMPVRAGNLLETPLSQLYDCELFATLRDRTCVSAGCENCLYAHLCGGGLRCLAFATTGDRDLWRGLHADGNTIHNYSGSNLEEYMPLPAANVNSNLNESQKALAVGFLEDYFGAGEDVAWYRLGSNLYQDMPFSPSRTNAQIQIRHGEGDVTMTSYAFWHKPQPFLPIALDAALPDPSRTSSSTTSNFFRRRNAVATPQWRRVRAFGRPPWSKGRDPLGFPRSSRRRSIASARSIGPWAAACAQSRGARGRSARRSSAAGLRGAPTPSRSQTHSARASRSARDPPSPAWIRRALRACDRG
jgi:radical SAM protein with 4Fe4S-binding SPASM domain